METDWLGTVLQSCTVYARSLTIHTSFNVTAANAGFIPVVSAKAHTQRVHTPGAVVSPREVMKRSTAMGAWVLAAKHATGLRPNNMPIRTVPRMLFLLTGPRKATMSWERMIRRTATTKAASKTITESIVITNSISIPILCLTCQS